MSKILFNRNNIEKSLKRGLSLVLTLTTLGTFAGCTSNEATDINTESSSIVGTLLEDEKVYDFSYVEGEEESILEVYDWSETESIIKEKDTEAWKLIYTNSDEVNGISKNKYAAVICEEQNDFGNTYYRLIDSNGNFLSDEKYKDIYKIDDHNFICCETAAVDRDGLDNSYKFILFNQITGEKVSIDALSLTGFNGFVIKSNYEKSDGFGNLRYELLNSDGTKATDILYDDREFDFETGILYLTKDGITEAIDTKTKKVRKIEGVVEESSNGYVIVRNTGENGSIVNVLYLDDINQEPKKVMSYEGCEVTIGVSDKENPMFVVKKYNSEATSYDCLFVDKDNNTLLQGQYDFVIREYENNTVKAFRTVKLGEDKISLVDVINAEGQIVADDISHDYFTTIFGNETYIFRNKEDSKYGVGNFNGEYLMYPSFDNLLVHSIYQEQEDGCLKAIDCYLIGRLEGTNQTVIYTNSLEEIGRGNYGLLDAEDIADKHYVEKENSKRLIKEN